MQVKLYPFQKDIFDSLNKNKFTTLCVGRRCGKSYAAALAAVLHCVKKPYRRVLIVGPTLDMARQSYWDQLGDFCRELNPAPTIKVQEKEIHFTNGSVINLRSADKIDKIRGISGRAAVSLIIADEVAFLRAADSESLFYDVLMPYLANAEANCRFLAISTPKGSNGIFYKLYQNGLNKDYPDYNSIKYSAYDARPDLKEQYDELRKAMPEKQFAQEMLADFTSSGSEVFINFDPLLSLDHTIDYIQKDEPVVIGFDQNVGINAAIVCRIKSNPNGNKIEIIEEIQGKYKDIPSFCAGINERFKGHRITIVPDASIKARSAAAGIGKDTLSQFKDAGFNVRIRNANPPIIDTINVVNNFLLDPLGNRNLLIHPSCKGVIEALTITSWDDNYVDGHKLKKGTYDDHAHLLDCIRYVCWEFQKKTSISLIRNITTF